jgi:FlaA1/EpsC-like NDP-sugar epimerase
MRRRIRSAAFPVHRHALPQLLVDAVLVALAYFLAFWLRFEGGFRGQNHRYGHLFDVTVGWVVLATLITLAAFGQYQRLWRYVGRRDYEAVLKGVVVATVVVVGVIALLHPVTAPTTQRVPVDHFRHGILTHTTYRVTPGPSTAVNLPASVISL